MAATTAKPKRDLYAEATQRVLDQLEQGTVPWRRPWAASSGTPAKSLATGKTYRGINWLLTAMAGYESQWWLTFKQASVLEAQIRKGEHGTPLMLWRPIKQRIKTAGDRERAKADRLTIKRDQQGQYVERLIIRHYTVFNAEQVDGLNPELAPGNSYKGDPTWSPAQRAEAIAASYPQGPQIEEGGPRATYNPATDIVRMPDRARFNASSDWTATLFHELVHSTGHERRLHRTGFVSRFGSKEYAREELVAELGAAMLCAQAGIDSPPLTEQHAAYIAHWQQALADDEQLLIVAAQRAQKAADHILGRDMATE